MRAGASKRPALCQPHGKRGLNTSPRERTDAGVHSKNGAPAIAAGSYGGPRTPTCTHAPKGLVVERPREQASLRVCLSSAARVPTCAGSSETLKPPG